MRGAGQIQEFIAHCKALNLDWRKIERIASVTTQYLAGNDELRAEMGPSQELEGAWYAALSKGGVDWSVYESDWYLGELWACWQIYSRKYLKLVCPLLAKDLGKVARVVDLGCGVGLTTAALARAFPSAKVVGTNLDGTTQMKIAKRIAGAEGAVLLQDAPPGETDVVFASEFFEHLQEPIAFLRKVLDDLAPRALVVANSFNTRAIGHFEEYLVEGKKVHAKLLSRIFNAELRARGYKKVDTGFWNDRPAYWRRPDEKERRGMRKKQQATARPKRMTAIKIEYARMGDVKRDPKNPRKLADILPLCRSIYEWGLVDPIIVRREDGMILGGHQRYDAVEYLLAGKFEVQNEDGEMEKVAWSLPPEGLPVVYLEGIDDARARMLNIALNKVAGEWDEDMLASVIKDLAKTVSVQDLTVTGFSAEEIAGFNPSLPGDGHMPEPSRKSPKTSFDYSSLELRDAVKAAVAAQTKKGELGGDALARMLGVRPKRQRRAA